MNEATLRFIHEHLDADVRSLALRRVPADVDLHVALTQIEGHQLARRKLPTWAATPGLLWPPRLSLEQCSSEATAAYKRTLVQKTLSTLTPHPSPLTFADLTAGLGVDFVALASLFDKAVYVERQEALCTIARHNLPLLGLPHAEVHCATAEEMLLCFTAPFDLLLLDPARRDNAGRKVALLEDCTPNVLTLQKSLRAAARCILLKLSPMLDVTAAVNALSPVAEVHIVAVDGECKELLLVLNQEAETVSPVSVPIHCIDVKTSHLEGGHTLTTGGAGKEASFCFTRSEEAIAPLHLAPSLGTYLYEPNAALLKAGAFRILCQRYPVQKLAPSTHLYTSDCFLSDFPGRRWRIISTTTFTKRDLRAFLQDVPAADLTTRGFPLSTAQLRRQLHLREGGDTHLIATTLADGTRLLCRVQRI